MPVPLVASGVEEVVFVLHVVCLLRPAAAVHVRQRLDPLILNLETTKGTTFKKDDTQRGF